MTPPIARILVASLLLAVPLTAADSLPAAIDNLAEPVNPGEECLNSSVEACVWWDLYSADAGACLWTRQGDVCAASGSNCLDAAVASICLNAGLPNCDPYICLDPFVEGCIWTIDSRSVCGELFPYFGNACPEPSEDCAPLLCVTHREDEAADWRPDACVALTLAYVADQAGGWSGSTPAACSVYPLDYYCSNGIGSPPVTTPPVETPYVPGQGIDETCAAVVCVGPAPLTPPVEPVEVWPPVTVPGQAVLPALCSVESDLCIPGQPIAVTVSTEGIGATYDTTPQVGTIGPTVIQVGPVPVTLCPTTCPWVTSTPPHADGTVTLHVEIGPFSETVPVPFHA